jgi:hypothetical protein
VASAKYQRKQTGRAIRCVLDRLYDAHRNARWPRGEDGYFTGHADRELLAWYEPGIRFLSEHYEQVMELR